MFSTKELDSLRYDSPADHERAFRAVTRMTKQIPMLTAVLRAMTGNPKAQIQLTAGRPCTDGNIVWLRPPIELGDTIAHVRADCSKRDAKSHPICPACNQTEMIDNVLFHEMAHIVFNTFAEVTEYDKVNLLQRLLNEHPNAKGSRLTKLHNKVEEIKTLEPWKLNYMGLASLISPFMPTIVNALEDARVNRAMYLVRAGTYHMFRSKLYYVFEEGMVQLNGVTFHWRNEDENAQIIIGCLCLASDVEPIEGYLSPAVLTALGDPALRAEIASLPIVATTASDIYGASFRVLEHLRRLGFCLAPDDPEDDEQPQQGDPNEQKDNEASASGESEETEVGDGGRSDSESDEKDSSDSQDDIPGDDGTDSDAGSDDVSETDSGDNDEQHDSNDDSADDDGESEDEDSSESGGKSQAGSDDKESDGEDSDDNSDEAESGNGSSDNLDDNADEDAESQDSGAGSDDADEAAKERMNATDPAAVARLVQMFGGHDPDQEPDSKTERQLGVAITQAGQFDEPSATVTHFNVHRFEQPNERAGKMAWRILAEKGDSEYGYGCNDEASEYEMPESLVGSTLLKMRTIFADNKKAKRAGELRSGRIISQRLPSVMAGNTKVFTRNQKPGKKDYFICVAMDVSISTTGPALLNIKLMGMAIGNLLSRSGVKFAIYAHTGGRVAGIFEGDVFVIKEEREPWDERSKNRLAKLNSSGNNLDGHAMEFFRKRLDESQATDKVMFYVTDGAMPEANGPDELEVLVRELKVCKDRGYTVVGVGIETNSPSRHGLDTIQVDEPRDIAKLINDLGKRLAVKV